MVSEKPSIERRWRSAMLLFLGTFIACTLIALILVRVLPSDMEWVGIPIPLVIAAIGTLAGIAGCLCAVILVEMRNSWS